MTNAPRTKSPGHNPLGIKTPMDKIIRGQNLMGIEQKVGSLPTKDGLLCAVCMLLCMALGFTVLPGVLTYVSYMGELTV